MIRLTKLTDYGIVLLGQIASGDPSVTHNARDLAAQTRLTLPMVSKILKALARGGLLVSQRGTKGGYNLAQPADKIPVTQIIHALEGPIAITECTGSEGDCHCGVQRHCPVRISWRRINDAINGALAGITLADMIEPMPNAQPAGNGSGKQTVNLSRA